MHSDERRKAIADVLRAADAPVSASALAEKFSVSRQIIVGDIALLRSSGEEILATPRGYVTPKEARGILRRVAVKHTPQEMEAELNTIVDNGCTVIDVIVDHPIYGQLTGPLQISNIPRSVPPVIFNRTDLDPSIDVSSNGDLTYIFTFSHI